MGKKSWQKTRYPGVRFREHPTRKHGIGPDKYYSIRFRSGKLLHESGVGWSSSNVNAKKAAEVLAELKKNAKDGVGPLTLAEKRRITESEKKRKEEQERLKSKKDITFGEFFKSEYYPNTTAGGKKEKSLKAENIHFKLWLAPIIGIKTFEDITEDDFELIRDRLLNAKPRIYSKKKGTPKGKFKGRSPRSIQYIFSTSRQCWNYALRKGITSKSWPGQYVKLPQIKNQRMRFLNDSEGRVLLQGLRARSEQLHDISLLSFDAGLRADEIFSLKWDRIDLTEKSMRILDSKGADRTVYMTERIYGFLNSRERHGDFVFYDRNGEKIKEISASFDREVKRLGWNDRITDRRDKLVFHSLRHSYASRLLERGIALYKIKELLGHQSIKTTERYSHLDPNFLKAAVKTLDRETDKKDQRTAVETLNHEFKEDEKKPKQNGKVILFPKITKQALA